MNILKNFSNLSNHKRQIESSRLVELQQTFLEKSIEAYETNNELYFLNLEAFLKCNTNQQIINTKNYFLQDYPNIDRRFSGAVWEFEVIVPLKYNHENQLRMFKKNFKQTFNVYDALITDKNFCNPSNQLDAGSKFLVKIFPIFLTVTSCECISFLKKQNALFMGAQGISLIYSNYKNQIPKGKFLVSFDFKDNLYKNKNGINKVPLIYNGLSNCWSYSLNNFDSSWNHNYYLLCFCKTI
ncbi:MAG: hypothetical protein ABIY50_10705 [Ignavibacteria bacterium]